MYVFTADTRFWCSDAFELGLIALNHCCFAHVVGEFAFQPLQHVDFQTETFAACNIDLAGNYTLTASDGSLTTAVSGTVGVTVGAENRLVFTTQPVGAVGGATIMQAVSRGRTRVR